MRLRTLLRVGPVAIALLALVVLAQAPTDNRRTNAPPARSFESADPLIDDMRRFFSSRDMTVHEAAEVMRSALTLQQASDDRTAAGCHGPAPKAERSRFTQDPVRSASQAMLDLVIAELLDEGPGDLAALVEGVGANGGTIRVDDQGRLDDATIALQVGNDLIVSDAWVLAAFRDPTSVYGSIAHEIGGHMSYDTPLSCVILETALSGSAAISDFDEYRAAWLTYVYPETEIYAELRELPYVTATAIGDDPYVDIFVQIHKIEAAYPPELAELILDWLLLRCEEDRLAAESRRYCAAALS